jgi:hypothetical protein
VKRVEIAEYEDFPSQHHQESREEGLVPSLAQRSSSSIVHFSRRRFKIITCIIVCLTFFPIPALTVGQAEILKMFSIVSRLGIAIIFGMMNARTSRFFQDIANSLGFCMISSN